MRKTVYVCAIGALACVSFAVAQMPEQTESQSTTGSSQSTSQSTTQSTSQSGQSSFQQNPRVQRSKDAAAMLSYTQQARQAISQKNEQAALVNVNRAIQSLSQAQSVQAPTITGNVNLVPIYVELERTSVIGPLQASRSRAAGQPTTAEREQTTTTGAAERAAGGAPVVQDVEGGITAVAVDLSMAKDHLDAAKTALENNKPAEADAALAAVQAGVSMTSVQSDLPLVRARQNLGLAQVMAQKGNLSGASAPLQAAANSLQEYEQTSSTADKSKIDQLRQEISSYSSSIQQQSASQASSTIGNWWSQVSDMTDREIAQSQQQQQQQQQQQPQQEQPQQQQEQPPQQQPQELPQQQTPPQV